MHVTKIMTKGNYTKIGTVANFCVDSNIGSEVIYF